MFFQYRLLRKRSVWSKLSVVCGFHLGYIPYVQSGKNCSVTVQKQHIVLIFTVWGREANSLLTRPRESTEILFCLTGMQTECPITLALFLVETATEHTKKVEGNTATYNYSNGGYVLKMTRYYSSIFAIIRPKYESEENGGDTVKKFVIDVSEHQGVIDWNKAKSSIDGAIIRCGYGDDITSQDDKQYARNLAECERLNIPKGVYLYSYSTTETQAKSELAHILRLIKGHTFELPIFLDVEEPGTESFSSRACKIICDGLKASGFAPGVYSSTYWWNTYLNNITSYIRWVAHWNSVCGYTGDYLIWQYGTEYVGGINGKVDSNYYYGDFGETTATTETETTVEIENTEKSILDIYYQVYTDKSGWLPVVRNLSSYAGEDGEPIKAIRVYLNGDTLAVQTHHMTNGNIDKLTIFAGKHIIRYRVRTIGSKRHRCNVGEEK